MGRRKAARRWARRIAGPAGARAMEAYQFALSTLALARSAAIRGFGTEEFPGKERELLTSIGGYRQTFSGRDPQMPPGAVGRHQLPRPVPGRFGTHPAATRAAGGAAAGCVERTTDARWRAVADLTPPPPTYGPAGSPGRLGLLAQHDLLLSVLRGNPVSTNCCG